MTPFRNDDGNPFARDTPWPKMPQAPMRLTGLPKASPPASPARGFGLEAEAFAPPKVISPPAPEPAPAPIADTAPEPQIVAPFVAQIAPRPTPR